MEIKKINDKVKLNEENVKAERDEYACHHDCIEYYYSGSTGAKGCTRRSTITAKTTRAW
ncbi:MAG: hypothetical protein J5582_04765 [Ruminococcus sp.]|uniref:Uncharacterized protein n=1 Tax=Ruminococcus albus TaxID=1264 RepID=A0A1I1P622_RUMAL|nr:MULTISPECIES: hypothetical protein [Ruminococcus]MBO4865864.1 hypothetical protein [Ruminococcus sp.]SEK57637.1 hypothetical protein SAMN05216469_103249 [Ruminococcus albus]SFD05267.1 hypothetical protein SAMN02910406_02979 [Ruminococcus albus]